jgi:hypothetical protein
MVFFVGGWVGGVEGWVGGWRERARGVYEAYEVKKKGGKSTLSFTSLKKELFFYIYELITWEK